MRRRKKPEWIGSKKIRRLLSISGVFILNSLFQGGPEPPAPGPLECGPDPDEDAIDCGEYPNC